MLSKSLLRDNDFVRQTCRMVLQQAHYMRLLACMDLSDQKSLGLIDSDTDEEMVATDDEPMATDSAN